MKDESEKYGPWFRKGTHMNQMLHCGKRYNGWVEMALDCLPPEVLDSLKESIALISTGESDGCRVARALCEQREIIVLSERILPLRGMNEGDPEVRYFMFVVLHEVAHAYRKHRSPMFDGITPDENAAQEAEADDLALCWYNGYVSRRANPNLPELTIAEIKLMQVKNKERMEGRYLGSNRCL